MNPHALNVLEYRDALDIVARYASSALGGDAVRALEPSADLGWIEPELARVDQMRGFLRGDSGWYIPAIPDVRDPLRKLRVEGLRARRHPAPRRGDAPGVVAGDAARDPGSGGELSPAGDARRRAGGGGEGGDGDRAHRGRPRHRARRGVAAPLPHAPRDQERAQPAGGEAGGLRLVAPGALPGAGRVGDGARGALRDPHPPRGARRGGRYRARRERDGGDALRGAARRRGDDEPPPRAGGDGAARGHAHPRELSARLRPLQPELLATLDAMVALDSVYARARYALKSDGHVPRLLPAGRRSTRW
jgi:DNA mismatch repair protein MutS2